MKKMILHITKDKYSNFVKEFIEQSRRSQERKKSIANHKIVKDKISQEKKRLNVLTNIPKSKI